MTEKIFLEDLADYLAKLAEKSNNVYWLSSADFSTIEYISPAFETIWGTTREALYKNPNSWIEFLHPEDKQNHHPIESMRERIAQEGAKARYEENYRIRRPDGEVRWILDRGFPVVDHQGNCCGVTGVAIDITKEKQTEQALAHAKEQAELASQTKSEFLMNMSHDFRTPFNGLVGVADMLEKQEQDPKKKQLLSLLTRSASTLLNLHNEIFEFARLENGLMPIIEKPFSLYELLLEHKQMMAPSAYNKNLDYKVKWDINLPEVVIGDKMRLQRILMNLTSNAIKFTSSGSVHINVAAKPHKERHVILTVNVMDTGCGIPSSKQEFIFQKFTRIASAYSGNYQGFGFGLRFVKQYVEDLEGEICLDSEPGKGSTFKVMLPFKLPLN